MTPRRSVGRDTPSNNWLALGSRVEVTEGHHRGQAGVITGLGAGDHWVYVRPDGDESAYYFSTDDLRPAPEKGEQPEPQELDPTRPTEMELGL